MATIPAKKILLHLHCLMVIADRARERLLGMVIL